MKKLLSLIVAYALLVVAGCGYQSEAPESAHIVTVTDASFEEQVLDNSKPVLVDFWATWCGPCKTMAPRLSSLADEFAGEAVIAKLDIDRNTATPKEYEILGYPTMLIFKDGREVDRFEGVTDQDELAAALSKLAGK